MRKGKENKLWKWFKGDYDPKTNYSLTIWLLNKIPYIILIFLLFFTIIKLFNSEEKFNPETDVCLLFEPTIPSSRCIPYLSINDDRTYNECTEERVKCVEWRPKSQCELGNESWKEEDETFLSYDRDIPFDETNCSPIPNDPKLRTICKLCQEKTQQELNQDYCNIYPNDDNKCECKASKKMWIINTTRFSFTHPELEKFDTRKDIINHFNNEYGFEDCFRYSNTIETYFDENGKKLVLMKQNFKESTDLCYHDYGDYIQISFQINNQINYYQQNQCIKAIPK